MDNLRQRHGLSARNLNTNAPPAPPAPSHHAQANLFGSETDDDDELEESDRIDHNNDGENEQRGENPTELAAPSIEVIRDIAEHSLLDRLPLVNVAEIIHSIIRVKKTRESSQITQKVNLVRNALKITLSRSHAQIQKAIETFAQIPANRVLFESPIFASAPIHKQLTQLYFANLSTFFMCLFPDHHGLLFSLRTGLASMINELVGLKGKKNAIEFVTGGQIDKQLRSKLPEEYTKPMKIPNSTQIDPCLYHLRHFIAELEATKQNKDQKTLIFRRILHGCVNIEFEVPCCEPNPHYVEEYMDYLNKLQEYHKLLKQHEESLVPHQFKIHTARPIEPRPPLPLRFSRPVRQSVRAWNVDEIVVFSCIILNQSYSDFKMSIDSFLKAIFISFTPPDLHPRINVPWKSHEAKNIAFYLQCYFLYSTDVQLIELVEKSIASDNVSLEADVEPMRALPLHASKISDADFEVKLPTNQETYVVQDKYDGQRLIVYLLPNDGTPLRAVNIPKSKKNESEDSLIISDLELPKFRLSSRQHTNYTLNFFDPFKDFILGSFRGMKNIILDGEIVAYNLETQCYYEVYHLRTIANRPSALEHLKRLKEEQAKLQLDRKADQPPSDPSPDQAQKVQTQKNQAGSVAAGGKGNNRTGSGINGNTTSPRNTKKHNNDGSYPHQPRNLFGDEESQQGQEEGEEEEDCFGNENDQLEDDEAGDDFDEETPASKDRHDSYVNKSLESVVGEGLGRNAINHIDQIADLRHRPVNQDVLVYRLFDILYYEGASLLTMPYYQRRQMLLTLFSNREAPPFFTICTDTLFIPDQSFAKQHLFRGTRPMYTNVVPAIKHWAQILHLTQTPRFQPEHVDLRSKELLANFLTPQDHQQWCAKFPDHSGHDCGHCYGVCELCQTVPANQHTSLLHSVTTLADRCNNEKRRNENTTFFKVLPIQPRDALSAKFCGLPLRKEFLQQRLNCSLQRGLEGLVVKTLSGNYQPHVRTVWTKIKPYEDVDLVIIGCHTTTRYASEGLYGKFLLGSFDLGSSIQAHYCKYLANHTDTVAAKRAISFEEMYKELYKDPSKIDQDCIRLRYVGSVSGGFEAKDCNDITRMIKRLKMDVHIKDEGLFKIWSRSNRSTLSERHRKMFDRGKVPRVCFPYLVGGAKEGYDYLFRDPISHPLIVKVNVSSYVLRMSSGVYVKMPEEWFDARQKVLNLARKYPQDPHVQKMCNDLSLHKPHQIFTTPIPMHGDVTPNAPMNRFEYVLFPIAHRSSPMRYTEVGLREPRFAGRRLDKTIHQIETSESLIDRYILQRSRTNGLEYQKSKLHHETDLSSLQQQQSKGLAQTAQRKKLVQELSIDSNNIDILTYPGLPSFLAQFANLDPTRAKLIETAYLRLFHAHSQANNMSKLGSTTNNNNNTNDNTHPNDASGDNTAQKPNTTGLASTSTQRSLGKTQQHLPRNTMNQLNQTTQQQIYQSAIGTATLPQSTFQINAPGRNQRGAQSTIGTLNPLQVQEEQRWAHMRAQQEKQAHEGLAMYEKKLLDRDREERLKNIHDKMAEENWGINAQNPVVPGEFGDFDDDDFGDSGHNSRKNNNNIGNNHTVAQDNQIQPQHATYFNSLDYDFVDNAPQRLENSSIQQQQQQLHEHIANSLNFDSDHDDFVGNLTADEDVQFESNNQITNPSTDPNSVVVNNFENVSQFANQNIPNPAPLQTPASSNQDQLRLAHNMTRSSEGSAFIFNDFQTDFSFSRTRPDNTHPFADSIAVGSNFQPETDDFAIADDDFFVDHTTSRDSRNNVDNFHDTDDRDGDNNNNNLNNFPTTPTAQVFKNRMGDEGTVNLAQTQLTTSISTTTAPVELKKPLTLAQRAKLKTASRTTTATTTNTDNNSSGLQQGISQTSFVSLPSTNNTSTAFPHPYPHPDAAVQSTAARTKTILNFLPSQTQNEFDEILRSGSTRKQLRDEFGFYSSDEEELNANHNDSDDDDDDDRGGGYGKAPKISLTGSKFGASQRSGSAKSKNGKDSVSLLLDLDTGSGRSSDDDISDGNGYDDGDDSDRPSDNPNAQYALYKHMKQNVNAQDDATGVDGGFHPKIITAYGKSFTNPLDRDNDENDDQSMVFDPPLFTRGNNNNDFNSSTIFSDCSDSDSDSNSNDSDIDYSNLNMDTDFDQLQAQSELRKQLKRAERIKKVELYQESQTKAMNMSKLASFLDDGVDLFDFDFDVDTRRQSNGTILDAFPTTATTVTTDGVSIANRTSTKQSSTSVNHQISATTAKVPRNLSMMGDDDFNEDFIPHATTSSTSKLSTPRQSLAARVGRGTTTTRNDNPPPAQTMRDRNYDDLFDPDPLNPTPPSTVTTTGLQVKLGPAARAARAKQSNMSTTKTTSPQSSLEIESNDLFNSLSCGSLSRADDDLDQDGDFGNNSKHSTSTTVIKADIFDNDRGDDSGSDLHTNRALVSKRQRIPTASSTTSTATSRKSTLTHPPPPTPSHSKPAPPPAPFDPTTLRHVRFKPEAITDAAQSTATSTSTSNASAPLKAVSRRILDNLSTSSESDDISSSPLVQLPQPQPLIPVPVLPPRLKKSAASAKRVAHSLFSVPPLESAGFTNFVTEHYDTGKLNGEEGFDMMHFMKDVFSQHGHTFSTAPFEDTALSTTYTAPQQVYPPDVHNNTHARAKITTRRATATTRRGRSSHSGNSESALIGNKVVQFDVRKVVPSVKSSQANRWKDTVLPSAYTRSVTNNTTVSTPIDSGDGDGDDIIISKKSQSNTIANDLNPAHPHPPINPQLPQLISKSLRELNIHSQITHIANNSNQQEGVFVTPNGQFQIRAVDQIRFQLANIFTNMSFYIPTNSSAQTVYVPAGVSISEQAASLQSLTTGSAEHKLDIIIDRRIIPIDSSPLSTGLLHHLVTSQIASNQMNAKVTAAQQQHVAVESTKVATRIRSKKDHISDFAQFHHNEHAMRQFDLEKEQKEAEFKHRQLLVQSLFAPVKLISLPSQDGSNPNSLSASMQASLTQSQFVAHTSYAATARQHSLVPQALQSMPSLRPMMQPIMHRSTHVVASQKTLGPTITAAQGSNHPASINPNATLNLNATKVKGDQNIPISQQFTEHLSRARYPHISINPHSSLLDPSSLSPSPHDLLHGYTTAATAGYLHPTPPGCLTDNERQISAIQHTTYRDLMHFLMPISSSLYLAHYKGRLSMASTSTHSPFTNYLLGSKLLTITINSINAQLNYYRDCSVTKQVRLHEDLEQQLASKMQFISQSLTPNASPHSPSPAFSDSFGQSLVVEDEYGNTHAEAGESMDDDHSDRNMSTDSDSDDCPDLDGFGNNSRKYLTRPGRLGAGKSLSNPKQSGNSPTRGKGSSNDPTLQQNTAQNAASVVTAAQPSMQASTAQQRVKDLGMYSAQAQHVVNPQNQLYPNNNRSQPPPVFGKTGQKKPQQIKSFLGFQHDNVNAHFTPNANNQHETGIPQPEARIGPRNAMGPQNQPRVKSELSSNQNQHRNSALPANPFSSLTPLQLTPKNLQALIKQCGGECVTDIRQMHLNHVKANRRARDYLNYYLQLRGFPTWKERSVVFPNPPAIPDVNTSIAMDNLPFPLPNPITTDPQLTQSSTQQDIQSTVLGDTNIPHNNLLIIVSDNVSVVQDTIRSHPAWFTQRQHSTQHLFPQSIITHDIIVVRPQWLIECLIRGAATIPLCDQINLFSSFMYQRYHALSKLFIHPSYLLYSSFPTHCDGDFEPPSSASTAMVGLDDNHAGRSSNHHPFVDVAQTTPSVPLIDSSTSIIFKQSPGTAVSPTALTVTPIRGRATKTIYFNPLRITTPNIHYDIPLIHPTMDLKNFHSVIPKSMYPKQIRPFSFLVPPLPASSSMDLLLFSPARAFSYLFDQSLTDSSKHLGNRNDGMDDNNATMSQLSSNHLLSQLPNRNRPSQPALLPVTSSSFPAFTNSPRFTDSLRTTEDHLDKQLRLSERPVKDILPLNPLSVYLSIAQQHHDSYVSDPLYFHLTPNLTFHQINELQQHSLFMLQSNYTTNLNLFQLQYAFSPTIQHEAKYLQPQLNYIEPMLNQYYQLETTQLRALEQTQQSQQFAQQVRLNSPHISGLQQSQAHQTRFQNNGPKLSKRALLPINSRPLFHAALLSTANVLQPNQTQGVTTFRPGTTQSLESRCVFLRTTDFKISTHLVDFHTIYKNQQVANHEQLEAQRIAIISSTFNLVNTADNSNTSPGQLNPGRRYNQGEQFRLLDISKVLHKTFIPKQINFFFFDPLYFTAANNTLAHRRQPISPPSSSNRTQQTPVPLLSAPLATNLAHLTSQSPPHSRGDINDNGNDLSTQLPLSQRYLVHLNYTSYNPILAIAPHIDTFINSFSQYTDAISSLQLYHSLYLFANRVQSSGSTTTPSPNPATTPTKLKSLSRTPNQAVPPPTAQTVTFHSQFYPNFSYFTQLKSITTHLTYLRYFLSTQLSSTSLYAFFQQQRHLEICPWVLTNTHSAQHDSQSFAASPSSSASDDSAASNAIVSRSKTKFAETTTKSNNNNNNNNNNNQPFNITPLSEHDAISFPIYTAQILHKLREQLTKIKHYRNALRIRIKNAISQADELMLRQETNDITANDSIDLSSADPFVIFGQHQGGTYAPPQASSPQPSPSSTFVDPTAKQDLYQIHPNIDAIGMTVHISAKDVISTSSSPLHVASIQAAQNKYNTVISPHHIIYPPANTPLAGHPTTQPVLASVQHKRIDPQAKPADVIDFSNCTLDVQAVLLLDRVINTVEHCLGHFIFLCEAIQYTLSSTFSAMSSQKSPFLPFKSSSLSSSRANTTPTSQPAFISSPQPTAQQSKAAQPSTTTTSQTGFDPHTGQCPCVQYSQLSYLTYTIMLIMDIATNNAFTHTPHTISLSTSLHKPTPFPSTPITTPAPTATPQNRPDSYNPATVIEISHIYPLTTHFSPPHATTTDHIAAERRTRQVNSKPNDSESNKPSTGRTDSNNSTPRSSQLLSTLSYKPLQSNNSQSTLLLEPRNQAPFDFFRRKTIVELTAAFSALSFDPQNQKKVQSRHNQPLRQLPLSTIPYTPKKPLQEDIALHIAPSPPGINQVSFLDLQFPLSKLQQFFLHRFSQSLPISLSKTGLGNASMNFPPHLIPRHHVQFPFAFYSALQISSSLHNLFYFRQPLHHEYFAPPKSLHLASISFPSAPPSLQTAPSASTPPPVSTFDFSTPLSTLQPYLIPTSVYITNRGDQPFNETDKPSQHVSQTNQNRTVAKTAPVFPPLPSSSDLQTSSTHTIQLLNSLLFYYMFTKVVFIQPYQQQLKYSALFPPKHTALSDHLHCTPARISTAFVKVYPVSPQFGYFTNILPLFSKHAIKVLPLPHTVTVPPNSTSFLPRPVVIIDSKTDAQRTTKQSTVTTEQHFSPYNLATITPQQSLAVFRHLRQFLEFIYIEHYHLAATTFPSNPTQNQNQHQHQNQQLATSAIPSRNNQTDANSQLSLNFFSNLPQIIFDPSHFLFESFDELDETIVDSTEADQAHLASSSSHPPCSTLSHISSNQSRHPILSSSSLLTSVHKLPLHRRIQLDNESQQQKQLTNASMRGITHVSNNNNNNNNNNNHLQTLLSKWLNTAMVDVAIPVRPQDFKYSTPTPLLQAPLTTYLPYPVLKKFKTHITLQAKKLSSSLKPSKPLSLPAHTSIALFRREQLHNEVVQNRGIVLCDFLFDNSFKKTLEHIVQSHDFDDLVNFPAMVRQEAERSPYSYIPAQSFITQPTLYASPQFFALQQLYVEITYSLFAANDFLHAHLLCGADILQRKQHKDVLMLRRREEEKRQSTRSQGRLVFPSVHDIQQQVGSLDVDHMQTLGFSEGIGLDASNTLYGTMISHLDQIDDEPDSPHGSDADDIVVKENDSPNANHQLDFATVDQIRTIELLQEQRQAFQKARSYKAQVLQLKQLFTMRPFFKSTIQYQYAIQMSSINGMGNSDLSQFISLCYRYIVMRSRIVPQSALTESNSTDCATATTTTASPQTLAFTPEQLKTLHMQYQHYIKEITIHNQPFYDVPFFNHAVGHPPTPIWEEYEFFYNLVSPAQRSKLRLPIKSPRLIAEPTDSQDVGHRKGQRSHTISINDNSDDIQHGLDHDDTLADISAVHSFFQTPTSTLTAADPNTHLQTTSPTLSQCSCVLCYVYYTLIHYNMTYAPHHATAKDDEALLHRYLIIIQNAIGDQVTTFCKYNGQSIVRALRDSYKMSFLWYYFLLNTSPSSSPTSPLLPPHHPLFPSCANQSAKFSPAVLWKTISSAVQTALEQRWSTIAHDHCKALIVKLRALLYPQSAAQNSATLPTEPTKAQEEFFKKQLAGGKLFSVLTLSSAPSQSLFAQPTPTAAVPHGQQTRPQATFERHLTRKFGQNNPATLP